MQRQAGRARRRGHRRQRNERGDRRRCADRDAGWAAAAFPGDWARRRGSAIEPFVQLADAAGIAGLIAGLAAVGLIYDAVGAVALVPGLVSGQLAADRVATSAWGAPAETRLAPRPRIGSA